VSDFDKLIEEGKLLEDKTKPPARPKIGGKNKFSL